MNRFWGPEGFDAPALFFYLGSEHPAATLIAVVLLAWLGYEIANRIRTPENWDRRTGLAGFDAELPNARGEALDGIRAVDPAFDAQAFVPVFMDITRHMLRARPARLPDTEEPS